jgi:hypothetical protein
VWARFGSNTLANVLAGGSALVFQLGLTAMAARSFDAQAFSIWTLALSMAGLTPLFAVNLSAVVTRQLVPALSAHDGGAVVLVMAASRRLGRGLMTLAVFAILLAGLGLHRTSPNLASIGTGTFAMAVLVLTLGQLWQISIQPTMGWHFAREQNWPVAGALLLIRVCALIAMWLATRKLAGNLLATALCLALGHWVGLAMANTGSFRPTGDSSTAGPELKRQLFDTALLLRWFAVWSICMVAIQYGLPQLMSILGATHYNAFYLAYSLNLVLTGIVGAIGSAMLAPVTRLTTNRDRRMIVQVLTFFPLIIAVLLITALLGLRMAMPFLVVHWTRGIASADDINVYLALLGFQTIARSLSVVFGIALASRATAWRLVGTPLLELAVVLFVGVPLGEFFGERAFLMALAAAGLTTAIATAVVGLGVAGLERYDRRRVLLSLILTEAAALATWWFIAS